MCENKVHRQRLLQLFSPQPIFFFKYLSNSTATRQYHITRPPGMAVAIYVSKIAWGTSLWCFSVHVDCFKVTRVLSWHVTACTTVSEPTTCSGALFTCHDYFLLPSFQSAVSARQLSLMCHRGRNSERHRKYKEPDGLCLGEQPGN